jgi:SAM-dependent methyltransferase
LRDLPESEEAYWSSRALRELRFKDRRNLAISGDRLSVADGAKLIWCLIHNRAYDTISDANAGRVCDVGCGWGIGATVLAKRGLQVHACDVSGAMLRHTLVMARENNVVDCTRVVMARVEHLPYSGPFDAILAGALLHHVDDFDCALVAYEPLAMPLWDVSRKLLPYKEKQRSPGERALSRARLRRLEALFGRVEVTYFGPFLAVERVLMTNREGFARFLMTLDRILSRIWPGLFEKLAWYGVITCHKLT